jgi:signal transduction histidine kinase
VTSAESLSVHYGRTLDAYLAGGAETALSEAYELGRRMLCDGLTILDLARVHQRVLQSRFERQTTTNAAEMLRGAEVVFSEILSSFDMNLIRIDESDAARKRLNDLLEEELKRISLELHSEAGNILAQATLKMSHAARSVPGELQSEFDVARQLLHETGERLRHLSHELRPAVIDDFGLISALQFLADGVERRTGVSVFLESSSNRRVALAVELAGYRVVQEAINNALKHGGEPLNIDIRVEIDDDCLHCVVCDDGCGFDAAAALTSSSGSHLGIVGMQERAAMLGGDCQIHSSRGSGTVVELYVPL